MCALVFSVWAVRISLTSQKLTWRQPQLQQRPGDLITWESSSEQEMGRKVTLVSSCQSEHHVTTSGTQNNNNNNNNNNNTP
ncbi:hypothetical protein EYF80_062680 [Liparis tanakae]|uniref:Uncharacterized protein n=1 Tax=Liparis tanakae TaxID=230148 RepID=A0A4Z2EE74_9TELE|nr:hypothetical protein EYF80_062680 [Liparis tanakae]